MQRAGPASSAIVSAGRPPICGQARAAGGVDVEAGHGNAGVNQALGVDLAHQSKTDNGNRRFVRPHASASPADRARGACWRVRRCIPAICVCGRGQVRTDSTRRRTASTRTLGPISSRRPARATSFSSPSITTATACGRPRVENPWRPGWHSAARFRRRTCRRRARPRHALRPLLFGRSRLDGAPRADRQSRRHVRLRAHRTSTIADYAAAQVRELIARYKPSVLWNDIAWPVEGRRAGAVRRLLRAPFPTASSTIAGSPKTALFNHLRDQTARAAFNDMMKARIAASTGPQESPRAAALRFPHRRIRPRRDSERQKMGSLPRPGPRLRLQPRRTSVGLHDRRLN